MFPRISQHTCAKGTPCRKRRTLIAVAGLLLTPILALAGSDSSGSTPIKAARGEGFGFLAYNGNQPTPGTYQGTLQASPGDQSKLQQSTFTYQINDLYGTGQGNCQYATFTLTISTKSQNGGQITLAGSGTDCPLNQSSTSEAKNNGSTNNNASTSIQNFTYTIVSSGGCYQQWTPNTGTGNLTSTTNTPSQGVSTAAAITPNAGGHNPIYNTSVHLNGNLLTSVPQ